MQGKQKNTIKEKKYFTWKDRIVDHVVQIVIIIILFLATLWLIIRTVKYILAEQV